MNIIREKLAINATTIKIIAIVLMVADHIHQMFAPVGAPIWLTWFGRPVFVLFLFAAADSFHYTKNRKKYLLRLLYGSWAITILSEILSTLLPNENIVLMNNAFSTFFVTGLYMLSYDMFVAGIKNKKAGKLIGAIVLFLAPIAVGILFLKFIDFGASSPSWLVRKIALNSAFLVPNILFIEGGFGMVLLGLLFYIFRKWRWAQIAVLVALSAYVFIMGRDASNQWMMVFAAIPMALYNGEKGRGMKYFFYIFYPAHIYILYIIATLWKG